MARFAKISADQELERVRKRFGAAAFTLIRARTAIHERWTDIAHEAPRIMPCPCCQSPHAVVTEWRDEFQVLVHAQTRWRMRRDEVQTVEGLAEWDAIAAQAQPHGTEGASVWLVDAVFRVARQDLPIFDDPEPSVVYLSGGWRGRKTQLALNMFARAILHDGGNNVVFWFLAPILKQAWRLMTKMFEGKPGTPPVFPAQLVERKPANVTSKNQDTVLVDGTKIENQHGGRKGSGLEGESVRGILLDEAQKVTQAGVYQIARSRLMDSQGRMLIASVPPDFGDNCEWLEEEVVKPAKLIESRIAAGEETPRYFAMHELSSFDNPWVSRVAIQQAYDNTTDPIVRDRKYLGRWTSFGQYAYEDVWDEAKMTADHVDHSAVAWGFERDLTVGYSRKHFGVQDQYLGAADFNEKPQTVLIARVFERHDGAPVLVILDEQVMYSADPLQSARALARRNHDAYKELGLSIVADANGFHQGHRYGGRESQNSDALRYQQQGFHVRAPIDGPPTKASSGKSNPNVGESRTLVRELMRNGQILINRGSCPLLCDALPKAPNRPKRKADSNTLLDQQVYNLEDCLRYLVWKLFSRQVLKKHEENGVKREIIW